MYNKNIAKFSKIVIIRSIIVVFKWKNLRNPQILTKMSFHNANMLNLFTILFQITNF